MADHLISPSTKQLSVKSALHCCVPLCNSDSRYDNSIHFHKVPKDAIMKKKWIVKIRRDVGEHFKITKMTVVCSKHFKQEDYRAWTPVRKCLKPTSVPSVFDWSSDKPKRRALKRKILADDSVQVSTGDDSLPQQASSSTAEFTETLIQKDTIEIERLQKELADQKVENEFLNQQLQLEKFGITRFSLNSSLVSFYTGFSSYFAFVWNCGCFICYPFGIARNLQVLNCLALYLRSPWYMMGLLLRGFGYIFR